jgi:hypothetical protein
MAALVCMQRSTRKPDYTLEPFDPDFRDLDLPPEEKPEPASGAVCGTSDWWRYKQHLNTYTNGGSKERLKAMFDGIATGIQWGLIKE